MANYKIVRKDEALVSHLTGAGKVDLIAKDDQLEIVMMEVFAGKSLLLNPEECAGALYGFYILEGVLNSDELRTTLSAGDFISAKDLAQSIHFDIVETTKMLMVTQKTFFDHQIEFLLKMSEHMTRIQEKDSYTELHCNRTGNLAVKMGILLGLTDARLNALMRASKIHDIGKIHVPLEILNKPGQYTQEEFDIMKRHPLDGYTLIEGHVSELEAKIVKQHHEKWNGTGYPEGLKGEAILLESRILAVADAYDALTSDRAYRQAFSQATALEILSADAGSLWDSEVFEVLKKVLFVE